MVTKHVVVVPYDEKWIQDFYDIKLEIQETLGDLISGIEHIGSTSVEGLSAKPVIDIDVVVNDTARIDAVISALAGIGYIHEGDLGIAGREAFTYEGKEHLKKHHLYVCHKDSQELKRHLAFRDYLRSNKRAVLEYSRIKEEGARLFLYDIDGYINHKSKWIENVYREIGF